MCLQVSLHAEDDVVIINHDHTCTDANTRLTI